MNEEWLRTLYVCLLVIAFIVLASIGADKAFATSPLPAGGWEIKKDDAGLPVMINRDDEKGVVFSFGYQNSKNCGDIRMIIGNVVPGKIEDAPENLASPSEMSTPSTDSIPTQYPYQRDESDRRQSDAVVLLHSFRQTIV